jgi:hypothetical protein
VVPYVFLIHPVEKLAKQLMKKLSAHSVIFKRFFVFSPSDSDESN